MYGFDILVSKYIGDESIESDHICYEIKVTEEAVDKFKIIDPGLLISIIDTYSSFAGASLFKDEKLQYGISVSMNLKVNSFGDMYLNEFYKMKVYLKNHIDKLIFYEIQILDKNGKLVKLATHLKKIVTARF